MSAPTSSGSKSSDVGKGVARVGGQNASLAEMVQNLDKRGVPVPPEFATTADVYWCYIDASGLKQTITTALTDFVSFLMPETKLPRWRKLPKRGSGSLAGIMSELRQDRTTGLARAIIAPERNHRPREWVTEERESDGLQHFDLTCPLCPGHKASPDRCRSIGEMARLAGAFALFPTNFRPLQANIGMPACRRHQALPGYGIHEVVIESPRHDADLATMTKPGLFAVVSMYRRASRRCWSNRELKRSSCTAIMDRRVVPRLRIRIRRSSHSAWSRPD